MIIAQSSDTHISQAGEGADSKHVHRGIQRRFAGTLAMTCSSTSHQVYPDLQRVERLAVVVEPPACLLHVWREATGLITHTSLIGEHSPVTLTHDGEKWLP